MKPQLEIKQSSLNQQNYKQQKKKLEKQEKSSVATKRKEELKDSDLKSWL